jgi:hypothetical protein
MGFAPTLATRICFGRWGYLTDTLRKDLDIPIPKQAKAEYAKLQ